MRSGILLSAILMAGSGLVSVPAMAQSAVNGGDAVATIETVTVTARRREEDLEKVPVAVTVLSADKLRTSEIRSVLDLQNYAPSLTVSGIHRRLTSSRIPEVIRLLQKAAADIADAFRADG